MPATTKGGFPPSIIFNEMHGKYTVIIKTYNEMDMIFISKTYAFALYVSQMKSRCVNQNDTPASYYFLKNNLSERI